MTALRFSLSLAAGQLLIAPASADEARGRISRIDTEKKEIRLDMRRPLRGGGGVLDLKVDDKTGIIIGGQPAKLSDLAAGRRIRVVFEIRSGKPVAQVIRSLGPLALPSPPAGRGRGEGGQPAAPPPAAPKEGEGVAGTLQRISSTDREIVVIGRGDTGAEKETTIAVPEETAIARDGKKITFDDLKEGETATVKTESRKGKLTAVSIQIGRPAEAKPAAPPRRNLIPRLRQALKVADGLLREMEEQDKPAPERPQPAKGQSLRIVFLCIDYCIFLYQ